MKAFLLFIAVLTLMKPVACLVAQTPEDPLPPPNRPNPAALRERAKNLSPEERQKMIREFREKHGLGGTNRAQWEKRWQELKQLPPAERAAKLRELRQEIQQGRGKFKLLGDEERDGKRKELKGRVDAQISELEKRQNDGGLTEAEQRRLDRMRQMSKRLEQSAPDGVRRPAPGRRSPPSNPDKTSPNGPDDKSAKPKPAK